jgi:hypothetical protein
MAQPGSDPDERDRGVRSDVGSFERLEAIGESELRWRRTARLTWTVTAGGKAVASLTWARSGDSIARAESAVGDWTLKRAGFLGPRVTVREFESDSDLAVMTMGWRREGTVRFADGASFQVLPRGFWHPEWTVIDARGRKMLILRPDLRCPDREAAVHVQEIAFESARDALVLTLLAWYVAQLISRERSDGGLIGALVGAGAI